MTNKNINLESCERFVYSIQLLIQFKVEVSLKKKEVRKKASEYFENEAELSESEWGSDDEDEMGMNRYETELGDADKFDKSKLKDELERIRLYVNMYRFFLFSLKLYNLFI